MKLLIVDLFWSAKTGIPCGSGNNLSSLFLGFLVCEMQRHQPWGTAERRQGGVQTAPSERCPLYGSTTSTSATTGEKACKARQLSPGRPGLLPGHLTPTNQSRLITLAQCKTSLSSQGSERRIRFIPSIFQVIPRTEGFAFSPTTEQSVPKPGKGLQWWGFAVIKLGPTFSLTSVFVATT